MFTGWAFFGNTFFDVRSYYFLESQPIVKFRSGDLVLSDCKGKGPLILFPQTLSATMKKVMPERNIHLVNSPDINCRSSE